MAEAIRKLLRDERLLTQAATAPFMEIDYDKSGYIDEKGLNIALGKVCTSIGATKLLPQQVKDLLKKKGKNSNGKTSFDDYLIILKQVLKKHLEKIEGESEENLRITQKKDDTVEKLVKNQIKSFEKYSYF